MILDAGPVHEAVFRKTKAVDRGFRVFSLMLMCFIQLNHSDLAEEERQVRKRGTRTGKHHLIWVLTVADTQRDKCTLIYGGNKAVFCEPGTLQTGVTVI